MEDMARLALVEQNLRDTEKFTKLLYELLRLINYILENPHDYELRTIESDLLKKHFDNEAFGDYLKYIGFQAVENDMIYPKEQTLSKLRMAQAALERKIGFCSGSLEHSHPKPSRSNIVAKKPVLTPANVLNTKNPLLLKLEALFNNMLRYEDEELQREARAHVPLAALQLAALDRVRDHQRLIKEGETKSPDLPFDIALLMELLGWFKHKFFKWVDKPECERCGAATKYVASSSLRAPTETCTVELYQCTQCPNGRSEFPRYNDPRTLLRTRRGRCGEWANCFTLLCRALGYDTRYIYDTTDHVWCEVYDYDTKEWLHVDPCEAKMNAPLLYSQGWGKQLAYVLAVSRDDLQDVTWRYTSDHAQVLKRRNMCSERALVEGILTLRERRQRHLSEARRRYLARRTLEELVQLMVERTAGSEESHGRVSGSVAWRASRGEAGAARGHEFRFRAPGRAAVTYCCVTDTYTVTHSPEHGPQSEETLRTWSAGAYAAKDVFRKVETDWQKVYLAREEGAAVGFVAWRLAAARGVFTRLRVRASHATFHAARVRWTLAFDAGAAQPLHAPEAGVQFERRFRTAELRAELSGGAGARAWQHAQLFRAHTSAPAPALQLAADLADL